MRMQTQKFLVRCVEMEWEGILYNAQNVNIKYTKSALEFKER